MANPFYVEMGFTKIEIASISKVFGVVATLAGVARRRHHWSARLGIFRALLVVRRAAGALEPDVRGAGAAPGTTSLVLTVTIGIENFTGGMGSAAFVAYLSSLCNVAFTATQYALLSSLHGVRAHRPLLLGRLARRPARLGQFFVLSTVFALPGLLLLIWMMRRYPLAAPTAAAPAASQ